MVRARTRTVGCNVQPGGGIGKLEQMYAANQGINKVQEETSDMVQIAYEVKGVLVLLLVQATTYQEEGRYNMHFKGRSRSTMVNRKVYTLVAWPFCPSFVAVEQ